MRTQLSSQTSILVTGAGGFAGSHLVELLQSHGFQNIFVTTYSSSKFLNQRLSSSFIFQGDLTDYSFTQSVIQQAQPQVIFHLAALSTVYDSVDKAKLMLTTNTVLQYNLLEAIRHHTPQARVLAICSANQYGLVKPEEVPISENQPFRPLNPYAVSKLSQEYLAYQYYLSYKLDVIRLRAFNHTGERQTPNFVIPAFAKQIAEIEAGLKPPVIKVGNLEAIRDFTYVGDMVKAYLLAAEKGNSGAVYNLGSGHGVKIQALLDKLIKLAQVKIEIEPDPDRLRPSDVPILIADNSKFVQLTGWQLTTSLDEMLLKVLNYWRQQIKI